MCFRGLVQDTHSAETFLIMGDFMPSGEILKLKKKSFYRMCIYRIIKDVHASYDILRHLCETEIRQTSFTWRMREENHCP